MSRKTRRRERRKGAGVPVMVKCLTGNLSFSFEPSRLTVSVRGVMGTGKSTFTAVMVRELCVIERRPVYVWMRQFKLGDTLPIYESQLGAGNFFVRTKTLLPCHLERLRNSIVVIEDAPSWLSSRSRDAMESLVSSYARANNTLAIIVSQKPQALPTALTFELDKVNGHFYYRAVEGRRASSWMEWTNATHLDADKFVLEGVKEGGEVGRSGRAVNKESKRQKAFAMFDRGCSNKEVEEALGLSEESVCVYRHQWKKGRRAANPYINILRLEADISGGGGSSEWDEKRVQQLNINLLRSVGGGGDEAMAMEKVWNEA